MGWTLLPFLSALSLDIVGSLSLGLHDKVSVYKTSISDFNVEVKKKVEIYSVSMETSEKHKFWISQTKGLRD
jgi:hypothetical protein